MSDTTGLTQELNTIKRKMFSAVQRDISFPNSFFKHFFFSCILFVPLSPVILIYFISLNYVSDNTETNTKLPKTKYHISLTVLTSICTGLYTASKRFEEAPIYVPLLVYCMLNTQLCYYIGEGLPSKQLICIIILRFIINY
jgi:hypothetical protein